MENWVSILWACLGGLGLVTGLGLMWRYRSQVRALEAILEEYQRRFEEGVRGRCAEGEGAEEVSRTAEKEGRIETTKENLRTKKILKTRGTENKNRYAADLQETRESRLESQLQRLLSQAMRSKSQAEGERSQVSALLSDLSHQLKTPLANVVMYTELLETEPEGQRRTEFLHETRRQAQKMQWLMKSMLKASRLEQGILSFACGPAWIKETLRAAVSAVYAQAEEREIDLIVEPFSDRKLYHNPKWTVEALGNILDNGIKYGPKGSRITLRVQLLELYTRIEIEDQGPGIPSSEWNNIFKRFYRCPQADQKEGNGLGLYLAQLILNKEKGYLTVSSRPGKGSCFQVYLMNA
mgnify:CR=1 FL=1